LLLLLLVVALQLYSACFAWAVHWVVARLLLKGLNVPSVPWAELLAYTGYPFVSISITIVAGFLAGEHCTCTMHGAVCAALWYVCLWWHVLLAVLAAQAYDK
jgi:hypothetical protein